jgi:asparagine synthase (glutamine-hydrolysing)
VGLRWPEGYESVTESGAQHCATYYDRHGMDFAAGLNGNFVGAVRHRGSVSLFTDRLGTRPLYYARTDGGVVFSTSIQSLPLHPGVETEFDVPHLAEYLALKRSFGTRTPLTGVEMTRLGSVATLDPEGGMAEERYWRPVRTPLDRSRGYFVDRLTETFRTVVADRTERAADYGLLLSGGSDSRLALAALDALDVSVHAFHLAEWRNREARTARRVAEAAGVPFTLLRRDDDPDRAHTRRRRRKRDRVGAA